MPAPTRIPETRRLNEILPAGREGGLEFARIVDLLLFHEARRHGRNLTLFSDRAGDYQGLDSFADQGLRINGRLGYQYKFYPSPLSNEHRAEIKGAIVKAQKAQQGNKQRRRLTKWVLVTPDDLTESGRREGGGDVTWFDGLQSELHCKFALEHWGHRKLQSLFLETPALCLFYYPSLVPEGATLRHSIDETRLRYDQNLRALYGRIEFVGMSVYKPEATRGVPMEHIYIPLATVPELADDRNGATPRGNPLDLLQPPGGHHVVLGDPGSGKSTLLKFLALAGGSVPLQQRCSVPPDRRLPILVVLRRYSDALKTDPDLSLLDYICRNLCADLSLPHINRAFLEYYLESGEAILLFDGMDELPNLRFKKTVRDRIHCMLNTYPGNTAIITSRIVGYENPYRFDEIAYRHIKIARLALPEMERFVADWYAVRVESRAERQANVADLNRILRDADQEAIRELAANPLLLTIIALVHRIDAVLPDERVVLYQKCTETLLNTWHTWKFRASEAQERRGKIERRNRTRIEALAYWMHDQAGGSGSRQRSVVPYEQVLQFLIAHIRQHERLEDPEDAQDLAEHFLEFVNSRAGLLIEVGDRQYSFVHLTFQEYLTATYLIARMERIGAELMWDEIAPRAVDPRWHEVIRLLIAGLRSVDSQDLLVRQLLEISFAGRVTHVALLLGGLLLDRIEAAELEAIEIVERLVVACVRETESEWIGRLVGQLRSLAQRGANEIGFLEGGFRQAWSRADTEDRGKHLLAGLAAGIEESRLHEITGNAVQEEGLEWQRLLLTCESGQGWRENIESGVNRFCAALAVYATRDVTNVLGAFVECALPPGYLEKCAFTLRLFLISDGGLPFEDYGLQVVRISDAASWLAAKLPGFERRIEAFQQTRYAYQSEPESENGVPRRDLLIHDAIYRAINPAARDFLPTKRDPRLRKALRMHGYQNASRRAETLDADWYRALDAAVDSLRQSPPGLEPEDYWRNPLSSGDVRNALVNMLILGIHLKPAALWHLALLTCFYPRMRGRLWLYQPKTWERIESRLIGGTADECDHFGAAWVLLLDLWLYQINAYDKPEDSPFGQLANLTRDMDVPPLRVAHCLRDLGYGREGCAEDLKAIVQSNNPAYRALFQEAMWID